CFFPIFAWDFIIRILLIHRRHRRVTFLDAILWRWYDLFLFIPIFRWLRIIPVTIRLNQSNTIDLSSIIKQARQGIIASIAEDLTEIVVIRLINQAQKAIRQGEISNFLSTKK
ncbi:hypothetical protein, partial [Anaplasma marginale]